MSLVIFSASAGTFAARLAALVRTLLLAVTLGAGATADAYNVANQLPNQIYLLVGGGVLAGLFVPRLARSYAHSVEHGDRLGSVLVNWTIIGAAVLCVALVAAGRQVINAMASAGWSQDQLNDATHLFYWFAPQIVGIALFSVIGQILNCYERFVVVEWLSCIASVFVSLGCVLVLGMRHGDMVVIVGAAVGVGTTLAACSLLGICTQAIALFISLKRTKFRFYFAFRAAGTRLTGLGRFAFLAVIAGAVFQASNVIVASVTSAANNGTSGQGYSTFVYATAVVSGVQAVVVSAASSMLLARVSRLRSVGDLSGAASTFNRYMHNLFSIILPIGGLMVVCGPEIGQLLFGYGRMGAQASIYTGFAISLLGIGLAPSALNVFFMRQLFAQGDGRHVLHSALNVNAVWIAVILISVVWVPEDLSVLCICLGLGLGYWYDMAWCIRWIRLDAGKYRDNIVTDGFPLLLCLWAMSVMTTIALRYGASMLGGGFATGSPGLLLLESCAFSGVYWLLTRNRKLGAGAVLDLVRHTL